MSIEDIRKNYENFTDSEILQIASEDTDTLSKEVIPILKNEITKRKLSPNLIEKIEKKQAYNTSGKFEEILTNKKIYSVHKSFRVLIVFIISIALFFLLNSFLGGSRIIVVVIILSLIIWKILPKTIGKIVEIKKDSIVLSLYPAYNFGLLFRLLIVFRILTNRLEKVEISYKDIVRIYKNTSLLDAGYYIKSIDHKIKQTFEHRLYLGILEKEDLNELKQVLKYKSINVEF